MIIYGSKNKELAKELLSEKCQNCGTQNCIDMHVFQKYAHVFWIPFFPMGKTGISQCDHCKQVLKLKEMPDTLRASYHNLKEQTKTPLWMYSGLVIVALIIVNGIVNDKQNEEKNTKLVAAPQKGDIFEIRTKESQYTTYKIEQVQGDSVFIRINNYETNKSTAINELIKKGDVAYSEEVYGISKTELKEMLDNGEIININRN